MTRLGRIRLLEELRTSCEQADGWERAVDLAQMAEREPYGSWITFHVLWTSAATWGPRVAAFTTARSAATSAVSPWPPLATLLSAPTRDPGVLLNTVAATQLAPINPLGTAVLTAHLTGFLERCKGSNHEVRRAAVELLARLANLECLTQVVSRDWLICYLDQTSFQRDSDQFKKLGALRRKNWKTPNISEFVSPDEFSIVPQNSSAWSSAARTAAEFLQKEVNALGQLKALYQDSAKQGASIQELRLEGDATKGGILSIATFDSVLAGWQRLYKAVYASLQGDVPNTPNMFLLAPQAGSFVIRLLVDPSTHSDNLATDAFELSVSALQGWESFEREGTPDVASSIATLHRALRQDTLGLTLQAATNGTHASRAAISLARLARASVHSPTEVAFTPGQLVGTLEGANHSTGRVTIRILENDQEVICEVSRASRDMLFNKTIGHSYVFEVEQRTRSGTEPQERFEIVRISPVADASEIGENPAEAIVEVDLTRVPTTQIPQQDTFGRIEQVVALMAEGKAPTPQAMGMPHRTRKEAQSSVRHVGYAKQAAKILGLVSRGSVSKDGQRLLELPEDRRIQFLAILFQTSHVGAAWLDWAGKADITELDPESASDFLRARGRDPKGEGLSESMIKRRGRTLRKWAIELTGSLET